LSVENVCRHYLTITEVAQALRVSKMTVYRLVHTHAFASVRFGKSYRIPEDAVEEYIRSAGVTSP
jgi:excisionase family DNA binding protein